MGIGDVSIPICGVFRRFGRMTDHHDSGLAEEERVDISSLVDGEECWLSSGVRGFMFGKVAVGSS
jgi:hypothetical protein